MKYSKYYYLKNRLRLLQKAKVYYAKNRNKRLNYAKQYQKKHRKKIILKKSKCQICGKEFIKNIHNKKYCSKICYRTTINKKYIKIKICPICNKEFIFDYFNHREYCSEKCWKICRKTSDKQRHKEYRKKYPQIAINWRIKNKDYFKNYKKLNKDKIRMQSKKYYLNNLKKIKKYRDSHKKQRNQRLHLKKQKNIHYKLTCNLRSRIWKVLKGLNKSEPTMKLVGCSIDQLKQHIEKQFKKGMSWDNWGIYGWHIDHIKPCASFDLTKESEQKKCFHYTNLQPLWAKENLKKYNHYI
jgi:hypothetical protein